MNYRTMKLFLTASEHDEAQVALARIARRMVFNAAEQKEKQAEVLRLMKKKDILAEEIRALEGRAA